MGSGMFVRPVAVTVTAQAPPPAAKPATAARKASRPSSMFTAGSGRGAAVSDPTLGKRMSLNAPSPSPVPRPSRPSSIARVS
jgi:dynactin 1